MNKKIILITFLLISVGVNAKLLKYEVTHSKIETFSFMDACQTMGHKHLLLVESEGFGVLDCMGAKIKVTDFCLKKLDKPTGLLRGYIDKDEKKVICQFGKSAHLKILCDKRDKEFCTSSVSGCKSLRTIFATSLELVHQSLIKDDQEEKFLNCYFSQDDDTAISLKKF